MKIVALQRSKKLENNEKHLIKRPQEKNNSDLLLKESEVQQKALEE